MKIIFLSTIFVLLLSCGKKSNPEYQGKHKYQTIILS
jgi:hypothetical protein